MWATVIGPFAITTSCFFRFTWLPAYLVESRNLTLSSMSIYTMFSFAGTWNRGDPFRSGSRLDHPARSERP